MKKLLALLAVVLAVVSCQKEINGLPVDSNGEAAVSLSVALPEGATRAAGADSALGAIDNGVMNNYDVRFILEVYDMSGAAPELAKERMVQSGQSTTATFNFRLVPGRDYNFVVWADFVEKGSQADRLYNTEDGLDEIEMYHKLWDAIDESRDAYTESVRVDNYNGTSKIGENGVITLTRPFAKLRVVTNDIKEMISIRPKTVTVKYFSTEFYPNYNALSETPYNAVEFDKELVVDLSNDFYTGEKPDSTGVQTLFADYFFAKEGDRVMFTMDVEANHGPAIPQVTFNTNIPVKRNNLTTVYGPILTDANNVSVTINPAFENGTAWNPEKDKYDVEVWDGKSQSEPVITTDEVTGETVAVIDQPSELAWLAAYVNGTLENTPSTFATRVGEQPVHFVLGADIDLGGHPWTPIGFNPNEVAGNEKAFTGTFDGQGHEIHNVYIDVKDQGGVGFFGAVNNATFKNFTLRNVFVKAVESETDPANISGAQGNAPYIAGGHIGAVVGYDVAPYGTGAIAFENVHVAGLVQIEGETRAAQGQRIGGIIGGRGYSEYTFKNVSVIGDEGSYIKGYCSTAGVVGQDQGVATFENVTTDIDVYAVTFGAGGIAGIVRQGSTFANCSSAGNITLDASKTQVSSYSANYPYRVGGIAGCWSESKTGVLTLTGCSYTSTLTSVDKNGNKVVTRDYAGYVGRGYGLNGCQGSKVVIDGTEYVQAYDTAALAGNYYVNGELVLTTAAALKEFAAAVNAGDTFAGKTVKLGADIDLNNEEWAPIGSAYADHGFMGNFDGNGYTIKNLSIKNITPDSDGYVYAGLFGVTEGTDKDNQNYIKNLVIENVTIDLNGDIVAAAVAYPYYTKLENITVNGDVKIKGGNYTAGVLAYTRRCVDAKNISIEATNGSIEGNMTVGGVISDIQMNGDLVANYSNFAASGLTIKGVRNIGGISGIIGGQTLNGAKVENVTIVSNDVRKGILVGSLGIQSAINNVDVNNVTGAHNYVGANFKDGSISSITIDGVVYEYLANGQIKVNGSIIVADGVILNEAEEYIISNDAGMFWFANEVNVNKNAFSGKTVKLAANIDLENEAWTPVGQTGATTFNGVFDGQNYTISNLNVNSEAQTGAHYSSGLFGWVESHTAGHGHIKNVKIAGATIVGHHNCGALVGYITQETALVENCHVTGATVSCTKANNDADGDKAGALIGNATVATPVKNCTAANSTVSAGRDAGQVIGAGKEANVTGCSATNVAVSANGTGTGNNVRNEVIGRLLS